MTIVNVALAPDYQTATVLVDSRARSVPNDTTKLFAMPHITAVLSGRGTLGLTATALHGAIAAPTFDDLRDGFDRALGELWRAVNEHERHAGGDGVPEKQEIVICGWHERTQRFRTWSWVQERAADGFAFTECESLYLSPCDDDFMADVKRICRPEDGVDLLDVTYHQYDWFRQRLGADFPCGGSLFAAQLSRSGINMCRVGSCDEAMSPRMRAVL